MVEVRALHPGGSRRPGWWPLPFATYPTREEAEGAEAGCAYIFGGPAEAETRVVEVVEVPEAPPLPADPLATPLHRDACPYCGGEKWSTDAHCGRSTCSQRYIDDVDGTPACTGCGVCYGDPTVHAIPEA
jgi:hypothetical protein